MASVLMVAAKWSGDIAQSRAPMEEGDCALEEDMFLEGWMMDGRKV